MFLRYIFKDSQKFLANSNLRKFSSEANSIEGRDIEEEKKDEKIEQFDQIADNLSCSSLDMSDYNTFSPNLIKEEQQPIKVLKTPSYDKIDFRLTPMYSHYKQFK